MIFTNATIYKMGGPAPSTEELERMAEMWQFQECAPSQECSMGLVPPRGEEHGALVESVAGHQVLRVMIETKAVPGDVVKRKADKRAAEIEQTTGRKPGKREMRDLREEVKQSLLPTAFPKRKAVGIWIDAHRGRLIVDTTSQTVIDEILTVLVKGIEGFIVQELHTATSATALMSNALAEGEPPAGFSIDRECELHATDASKAVIRYGHHPLDIEEIRQHIAEGKLPTKLAMTWDERVSFVLTDALQLRKIQFQDGVFENTGDQADRFDADVAITTGELQRLVDGLVFVLGGEVVLRAEVPA